MFSDSQTSIAQPYAGPDPAANADPLVELVLRCQREYHAWRHAETERSTLVAAYQRDITQLYALLAPDLRLCATRWRNDLASDDLDVVALNLFTLIVIELPRLRIDPARNVRGLLLRVANHRQTDEIRKQHVVIRPAPDHPATALSHGQTRCAPLSAESADEASTLAFEQILERVYRGQLLDLVRTSYWPERLSAADCTIMELRYQAEPAGFAAIAAALGAGWTEDAVRTRHFRVLRDTRLFLQANGLLDEHRP